MKKDLKKRIEEFNEIKYTKYYSKRIIISTLEVNFDKSLINKIVTG